MYEDHFGLRLRPFGESAHPGDQVALPSRDAARRRLRYGLEHGQGPALLFGPPGTGKTLLARALAGDLGGRSAHLTFPSMPADELVDYLAEELGARSAGRTGLASSLRRLKAALADSASRSERPLLIVDEAHLIDDPATFETLRLLLNFATTGPSDLSLLLVGGPEILLRLPPALSDRLTARCMLGPLSQDESARYVEGRLEAAGATEPLFDPTSLAELHRFADGLPRRLNHLADLALLIAFAEGKSRPEPRSVIAAAHEAPFDALAA